MRDARSAMGSEEHDEGSGRREGSDWVAALSWLAVERRATAGAIGLLPVGAGAKEHGRHLPNGTDAIQAAHYATSVAARLDALIWPVCSYGHYPAFTDYPGSISLRAATFEALVADIVEGIVRAGVRGVAILNTGVSTIEPLERVVAGRPEEPPVGVVHCYEGRRFTAAVASLERQAFGGHADEIETALMLAIRPQVVAMEHARAAPAPIVRGPFNRTRPDRPNYSPDGVNGDPTLASAAAGRRLLDALLADLIEEVRRIAAR